MIYDLEAIISSLTYAHFDVKTMTWSEAMNALRGALHDENTEIARLVHMRLETNPDILKQFTSEQKRAVAEWRMFWSGEVAKRMKHMPEKQKNEIEKRADAFADALFNSIRNQ